jgi:hypothetical protein
VRDRNRTKKEKRDNIDECEREASADSMTAPARPHRTPPLQAICRRSPA